MRVLYTLAAGVVLIMPVLGRQTGWVWEDNPLSVLQDPEYHNGPSVHTASVDRSQKGKVPYGGYGVWQCVNKGQIAVTYDDGPSEWTEDIVKEFDKYGFKATLFITGYNVGRKIDDNSTKWPGLIRKWYADGHQIGSHSWTHINFDSISTDEIKHEMYANEGAFAKVLGLIPTYMRPPFAVCSKACANVMDQLGYHITQFNLDTMDYKYENKEGMAKAIRKFEDELGPRGQGAYIVLNHDIKEWTAKTLTPYMLKTIKSRGYKAVTVGECLNDPKENWYRKAESS
jgi:peptidoglycan/xylan/chitin deacetylase (PgdA/CDA1 family)